MLRLFCRCVVTAALTAALALAYSYGTAKAALPGGDSINEISKPSTQWDGQVYPVGTVSDPTLCPPQAADPGNVVCDHFQLQTQSTGAVRTVVTWPNLTPDIVADDNDFDLLVCLNTFVDNTPNDNCTGGNEIATSFANAPGGFEAAVWNAIAGTTYEIRVIPFFVIGSDYKGCAAYVASGLCAPPPGGAGATTATQTCASNPLTATQERGITGGGNRDAQAKETFSLNVQRKFRGSSAEIRGKVQEKNDTTGTQLKSTSIDCVTYYDEGTDANGHPNGAAEIRGHAKLKQSTSTSESTVCFRAVARDRGEPGGTTEGGSDEFVVDIVFPNSSGACVFNVADGPPTSVPIAKGNIDYKNRAV
jgi:hypothetical protein